MIGTPFSKLNRAPITIVRLAALAAVAGGVCGWMAGCAKSATQSADSSSRPVIPLPTPPAASVSVVQAAPATGDGAAPSAQTAVDHGNAQTLTPTPALDSKIAKLEKAGGSNVELASLYEQRGEAREMDAAASPHVKYRAALADYRRALQLDPTNKLAATNKALIESIYRGMGMPVPD